MSQSFTNIIHRQDGSYVITQNGIPYHVPNEGEFADLWQEVNAYALAHPDEVTEELPPPEPEPPTPEEEQATQQATFVAAIDSHMNAFARTRGYDSMASAASYAGDEDPQFALEGGYCKSMRSRIYRAAWGILDAVLAGERPMPTIEDVLAELPQLAWPSATVPADAPL